MKPGIHPDYVDCVVRCSCGNTFKTRATVSEMHVELCNACHPFYTGQQKFVDTGGRVQRFADKFGGAAQAALEREAARKAEREAKAAEVEAVQRAAREKKAAEKAKRAERFAAESAKKAETEAAQAAAAAEKAAAAASAADASVVDAASSASEAPSAEGSSTGE